MIGRYDKARELRIHNSSVTQTLIRIEESNGQKSLTISKEGVDIEIVDGDFVEFREFINDR